MVRAMRPRQWIKNGLVLAAPALGATLLNVAVIPKMVLAFFAMCAAASATYLINDIFDRDRDRRHPTKCHRPIAAGEITVNTARVQAVVLAACALGAGALLGPATLIALATYLAVTLGYSRWGKHIAYVELGGVAAGFVLRVLVGAAASATAVSPAFIMVVGAAALFLAAGKRYAELHELGEAGPTHRPVLAHYTDVALLRIAFGSLAVAVLGYMLWALTVQPLTATSLWLALGTVALIVAARQALRRVIAGDGGDPTELILSDRVIQTAGAVAMIGTFVALYAL